MTHAEHVAEVVHVTQLDLQSETEKNDRIKDLHVMADILLLLIYMYLCIMKVYFDIYITILLLYV